VQFIISHDYVAIRSGFVVKYINRFVVNLIRNSMLINILKIGQYLPEIWTKVLRPLFRLALYLSVSISKRQNVIGFNMTSKAAIEDVVRPVIESAWSWKIV
jgi:hypothetical protein